MQRTSFVAGLASALTLLVCLSGCGTAKSLAAKAGGEAQAQAGSLGRMAAAAVDAVSGANFDYYVLALSWSPQHCTTPAGRRDTVQCGGTRRYSFIVHGLWPQYERGFPQDCGGGATLGGKLIQETLDIMPSPKLIRHEWAKHGTCSGLAPEAYFALARKAFGQFRAPEAYGKPDREIYVSPAKYKTAWMETNPGLDSHEFAVLCSGRFLQEVRVCLDRNLNPRACGSGVRDRCRVPEMIVQPLR
ncbi:MAG: ribonuclease T2 [Bryobacterales bacterium]|nr:ribonuclease T2 [Bryobacterales bacterium]